MIGKGAVRPGAFIDGSYLQNDILYWRVPRQTKQSVQAPAIINRFVNDLTELLVRHYASLPFRGGWENPAMVSTELLLFTAKTFTASLCTGYSLRKCKR